MPCGVPRFHGEVGDGAALSQLLKPKPLLIAQPLVALDIPMNDIDQTGDEFGRDRHIPQDRSPKRSHQSSGGTDPRQD